MIKVLLVDDQAETRRGLRMRLGLEPDLQVVGEAGDGNAALALAAELVPDVVLMDIAIPGTSRRIAATERLRQHLPGCPVVILTLYDDPVNRARAAAVGAVALVAKQGADCPLLAAIRAAAAQRATDS